MAILFIGVQGKTFVEVRIVEKKKICPSELNPLGYTDLWCNNILYYEQKSAALSLSLPVRNIAMG